MVLIEIFKSFLAGGMAGCIVDIILFPLESVKTKIQSHQPLVFSFAALYKGISWSLSSSFPCAAVFWSTYTMSKLFLLQFLSDTYILDFICACIGSFCCCLIRCPFELLKTLMISGKYKSFFEAPVAIVSKYGIQGLYVGFIALICRELPFDGIQMALYRIFSKFEFLNIYLGPFSLSGALASAVTAFITTPIDVVKTKIMTDSEKFRTVTQSAKIIFYSEGIFGFWRGWKTRVMFITLGGWLFYGSFNFLTDLLG